MALIPTSMQAIEIAGPGGPDVLRVVDRPVPEPRAGEVLVRVAAAGVNRPDVMQRQGKYPPPQGASDLPGLEVAGHIVEIGAGVTRCRAGGAVPAGAERHVAERGRGHSRDVLHGLDESVSARPADRR